MSFLTASYNSLHVIFSIKYWLLSFKVSLMVRRSKSIDDANRKVTILFWVLQGVVVLQTAINLAGYIKAYQTYRNGSNSDPSHESLVRSQLCLDLSITYIVCILLIDAFIRLNGLVKHDSLALSKS